MNSRELIDRCENLTPRKLDYWVNSGVFRVRQNPGRSGHRTFTEEDVYVAQVLARISAAFDAWSNGRGGLVNLYREAADQIRAGSAKVVIVLADGIELTATVPQPYLAAPPAPEPTPEAEVNYIPGIGADNA